MLKRYLILFLLLSPSIIFAQITEQNIKTRKQVIVENKDLVPEITPEELNAKLLANKDITLIDVRTEKEREVAHIGKSIWIDKGMLEFRIQDITTNPNAEIIVYCRTGGRSLLASRMLQELGYKNVYTLVGGINSWSKKGFSLYNDFGEFKVIDFGKKDTL